MKKAGLILPVILILSSLSLRAFAQAQDNRAASGEGYTISTNDILEISVYGEPDLSVTARVSQDGTVNYPFLGNIRAVGLTSREFGNNISDLLGEDYLVNPQVSVFIKEYAKISILGAVKMPGAYEMKDKLSLTQAIALASGFTDSADTSKVKIIREDKSGKQTFEVNVDQITDRSAEDVEIKAQDTIIVEEFGRFSVMGQVIKPGVYNLKKGLTVVEAVGLAGGFTNTASQNGTRVVRLVDGKKQIINVPVSDIMRGGDTSKDIMLQSGDTIVVPESFF